MKIFKLPDLGEGLPDAEIHEWHVKEGEHVEVDQLLVSMETAKAVVEVPSPYSGIVAKLHGGAGDIIETGQPLIEFKDDDEEQEAEYVHPAAATVAGKLEVSDVVVTESATGIEVSKSAGGRIKATPAVRALANKLNIDLSTLTPSGKNGEITLDDVTGQAKPTSSATKASVPEGLEALKGIRRTMAQIMSQSHAEVVPVVIVDDADIQHWSSDKDISVEILKALAYASSIEPALNAHFDGKSVARKVFNEVNVGLAVDSRDGLFVPVIKDVAKLSDKNLRDKIDLYKQQVSDRTIPQDDLHGATISLSNFGTFAGKYANPIIVPPCVAIIGIGRYRNQVVAVKDKMEIHRILPISVSFDHRAATGGEASRFLKAIIDYLQQG